MTFRHNLLLSLRWRQQNGTCPLHCTAKQASYLHRVSGFNWLRIRPSGWLIVETFWANNLWDILAPGSF